MLKSKVLGQGLDFEFEVSTPAELALSIPPPLVPILTLGKGGGGYLKRSWKIREFKINEKYEKSKSVLNKGGGDLKRTLRYLTLESQKFIALKTLQVESYESGGWVMIR